MDIQPQSHWDVDPSRNIKRKPTELRPNKVTLAAIQSADGSAEVSYGKTSVICAINGPLLCERPRQLPDRANIELNLHKSGSALNAFHDDNDAFQTNIPTAIKSIAQKTLLLENYPRQKFVITIQVVNDDGSLLSACFNALMYALIQGGFACRHTYVSIALSNTIENDEAVFQLDPTAAEEKSAQSTLTAAYIVPHNIVLLDKNQIYKPSESDENGTENVLYVSSTGMWKGDHLLDAIEFGHTASEQLADALRKK